MFTLNVKWFQHQIYKVRYPLFFFLLCKNMHKISPFNLCSLIALRKFVILYNYHHYPSPSFLIFCVIFQLIKNVSTINIWVDVQICMYVGMHADKMPHFLLKIPYASCSLSFLLIMYPVDISLKLWRKILSLYGAFVESHHMLPSHYLHSVKLSGWGVSNSKGLRKTDLSNCDLGVL